MCIQHNKTTTGDKVDRSPGHNNTKGTEKDKNKIVERQTQVHSVQLY